MNTKGIFLLLVLFVPLNLWVLSQTPPKRKNVSPEDYLNFRKEPEFAEELDFNRIDYDRINRVIYYLTNETRTKYKLPRLEYNPELEQSAMMHARDMVSGGFFNHINHADPKKQTPNDRARLCNIANPYLAENLIEGYGLHYKSFETVYLRGPGKFSKTPDGELVKAHTYLSFGEAQIAGWMNSKEHRKNLLSKEALQIGCGAAFFIASRFNDMPSFYVVQNFQWYQPAKKINP
jgi:uncharacterized protein YkwD